MNRTRLASIVALLAACNSPGTVRAPKVDPALGKMQAAVGADVREVPFSRVECTPEGDHRLVQLFYDRDVPDSQHAMHRPRILIARTRGAEVLEAHAFIPAAHFGENDYDMIQMIAKDVPGATKPECRVDSAGADEALICNNTTIIPWLEAGDRPTPSFRVTFHCG